MQCSIINSLVNTMLHYSDKTYSDYVPEILSKMLLLLFIQKSKMETGRSSLTNVNFCFLLYLSERYNKVKVVQIL